MLSESFIERVALDEFAPRWIKRGYTLIREPTLDQLPKFLQSLRPNAIAIGVKPSLWIEVLSKRGDAALTRLKQLQGAFDGQEDWRLEVVLAESDDLAPKSASAGEIQKSLEQVDALADSQPGAALLMAWATLEAIARRLQSELAVRSLSAASLIDLLISNGLAEQTDGPRLRQLGKMRNQIAHGQFDTQPSRGDIRYLMALSRSMLMHRVN